MDVSAYSSPLSAVATTIKSNSLVSKAAASYDERPSYRDDTVAAIQFSKVSMQRLERLSQVRDLDRADALVNVTLAGTAALEDALTQMKAISVRLQDGSLSTPDRERLANDYQRLNDSIDDLTRMASFAGRNLVNPDAPAEVNDLVLRSGERIKAIDLRKGHGTILAVNPPVKAPLLDDLLAAFDFEGDMVPADLGTPALKGIRNYGSLNYVDGEGGGTAVAASYYQISFIETAGVTVSASFKPNEPRQIIQHIISGDIRNAVTILMNDENRIVIKANGQTVLGPELNLDEWQNVSISASQSGAAEVYLDGNAIASVSYGRSMPTSRSSVLLYGAEGVPVDNLVVYSRALSAPEVDTVRHAASSGIDKWRSEHPSKTSWAQVTAELDQSLQNLRAVQSYFGGIAHSIETERAIVQRMADVVDAGVKRLIDSEIGPLGALRAANAVREQLAQAMMQSRTELLSAQTSLFSSALGLFDAINMGGFGPTGLETAGARGALQL